MHMSSSNMKYKGRKWKETGKQTMKITLFHKLILIYYIIINQTYNLLCNMSIHQVVTSKIKEEKETTLLNKL